MEEGHLGSTRSRNGSLPRGSAAISESGFPRRAAVVHGEGDVVDPRPLLLEKTSDRGILAEWAHQFDADGAGEHDLNLDPLVGNLFPGAHFQSEPIPPEGGGRIQVLDRDSDVVDSVSLSA